MHGLHCSLNDGGKIDRFHVQAEFSAQRARNIEKIVHDPDKPSAPKPEIPQAIMETLRPQFTDDVAALQEFAGRTFAGWNQY